MSGNLVIQNVLALTEHLNLSVKLVHFVFVLEDEVLIDIANLALIVLRAHTEAQVFVVEEALVKAIVLWVNLSCTDRQRKVFSDFEI